MKANCSTYKNEERHTLAETKKDKYKRIFLKRIAAKNMMRGHS